MISPLPDIAAKTFREVVIFNAVGQAADRLGVKAYVVGGYVRDLLLGKASKDYDFVCVGDGVAFAQEAAKTIGKEHTEIHIFKTFGTAQIKVQGLELEFVGARKESYSSDSRKPSVTKGTLVDDQLRRDFTINAMAICINKDSYGHLEDPFDGLTDLASKLIKTPTDPDITFSDDPLRMLRAIRFASKLGFDIDGDTFQSIKRNKHRIHTELNKIILSKKPSYGFKLLFTAGILDIVFPELTLLLGAQNVEGKTHKDNFYHTLEVLDNVSNMSDNLWLRWAAILHDIAKPATKKFLKGFGWTFHGHEDKGARMVPVIFQKFKLPLNDKMKYVQKLVKLHLRPISLVNDVVTDSAIRRLMVDAGEDLEDLMMLCKADVTTKNAIKAKRYLENFIKVEDKMREVEARDNLRTFQPVITGEFLMATFGLQPGPLVGQLKANIRQLILDGEVPNNLPEAWPFVRALAAKHQLTPITGFEAHLQVSDTL